MYITRFGEDDVAITEFNSNGIPVSTEILSGDDYLALTKTRKWRKLIMEANKRAAALAKREEQGT